MNVVGLDLSITHAGVAGCGWTETIRAKDKFKGHERFEYMLDAVRDYTSTADFVLLEAPAARAYDYKQQNAGLSWMVRQALWRREVPYGLVGNSNAKIYAAGTGRASKEDVRAALSMMVPWVTEKTPLDESDAAVLVLMGLDWMGAPLAVVPADQRRAFNGCHMPGGMRQVLAVTA